MKSKESLGNYKPAAIIHTAITLMFPFRMLNDMLQKQALAITDS